MEISGGPNFLFDPRLGNRIIGDENFVGFQNSGGKWKVAVFNKEGDEFKYFGKDPSELQIPEDSDDYEEDDSGDLEYFYYSFKPSGIAKFGVSGIAKFGVKIWSYNNKYSMLIEEFSTEPEGRGLGRKALNQLNYELETFGWNFPVGVSPNMTDEGKGFWSKMYDEGLVS